ncbi:MAG: hypothetical protein R2760_09585 [Chitinophagales bacterium]
MELNLRYKGNHNFIGRTVNGYEANKLYITLEAAIAFKKFKRN